MQRTALRAAAGSERYTPRRQAKMIEKPHDNIVNAGIVFMFTAWIQGQMSDLIIFRNNPSLIAPFVENPKRVPNEFHKIRVQYWEKQFGPVKNEFKEAFSGILTESEKSDTEKIYHYRNIIAHAHVSFGRDYILYRPSGGEKREERLARDLKLQPIENQSEPSMLKIEFWRDDKFTKVSDLIERFDQVTLNRIANHLGVPHGRIR
jgi:hypothetical protein